MQPERPPSQMQIRKTANVCRVNGTLIGMAIQEQMAIQAAARAHWVHSLVFIEIPPLWGQANSITDNSLKIKSFRCRSP